MHCISGYDVSGLNLIRIVAGTMPAGSGADEADDVTSRHGFVPRTTGYPAREIIKSRLA